MPQPSIKDVHQVITGRRRYALIQGDCLDVGRRLGDELFDVVIVDPPYGIAYQGCEDNRPPILNDKHPFIWWLYDAYRVLQSPGALACFCPWKHQATFKMAIEAAGFQVRSHVVWDRMNGGMAATHNTFAPRHDVVWFATKGRFAFPGKRPDSVLPHSNVPAKQREHSTQKPTPLMRDLVRALAAPGDIVYDPCMGSGSTGVAALLEGCRFVGAELDPVNYATAQRRLRAAARGDVKAKLARGITAKPMRSIAA